MRNIFSALLIFAGCGGWISVATAQDVRLNVDWSQQRWNGFPDSVGKPTSEWKDRVLHAHVVVLWNTSMVISEKNPRAFVHGKASALLQSRSCTRQHKSIRFAWSCRSCIVGVCNNRNSRAQLFNQSFS